MNNTIIRNFRRRLGSKLSSPFFPKRRQILGTMFETTPWRLVQVENGYSSSSRKSSNSSSKDYFQIMNIKRSFDISQDELKATYKKLMNQYHPDRHTLKPKTEQDLVAEEATKITQSYEALQDDHERALHLLELGGMPMEDTISGAILGQEFLMEVMELREEVDCATEGDELDRLRADNKERMDDTCEKLGEAFAQNDLSEAKRLTAMLQYWKRIDERINEKR